MWAGIVHVMYSPFPSWSWTTVSVIMVGLLLQLDDVDISSPVRIIYIEDAEFHLSINPSPPKEKKKPQNTRPTFKFPDPKFKSMISPTSPIHRFYYSLIYHPRPHLHLAYPPPTRMKAPESHLEVTRTQYWNEPIEGWQPESERDKLINLRFEKVEKTRNSPARSVKVRMCTKGKKIEKCNLGGCV